MIFVFLLLYFSFNLNVLAAKNDTNSNITKLDNTDLLLMKNFNQKNFDALLKKLGGTSWTDENQQTLLHIAASKGYYDAARALIKKDPRLINVTDELYQLPLHVAADNGHCKIFPLLIEKGANVNALAKYSDDDPTTKPHQSALQWAARGGHAKCVKILLDNKADVNHQDKDGSTALHEATDSGEFEVVKMLVEAGVDTSIKDNFGDTALYLAVMADVRNDKLVLYLAKHAKNPIHDAVSSNNVNSLNGLIAAGVDVYTNDTNNQSPLFIAAKNGYYDAARALIKKDPRLIDEADEYEWTALHYAARNGYCDIVSLLIEYGANVNALTKYSDDDPTTKPHLSPLHFSAIYGKVECVQTLLKYGANVNHKDKDEWTALHYAARDGHCDLLPLLLANGANVNALARSSTDDPTTKPHVSPLRLAAENGHSKCVKSLLDNKTDVNNKDKNGWTALHLAAQNSYYEIVKMLVEAGADTSVETKNEEIALELAAKSDKKNNKLIAYLAKHTKHPVHRAASSNDVRTLNALIAVDVKINTTNENQLTPLHITAEKGYYEATKALINKDPKLVNVTDSLHWFPLHFAARFGNCDLLPLLIENGANVSALAKYPEDSSTINSSVSALQLAARFGHAKCVQILLANGSKIEHKDHKGDTVLQIATDHGRDEVAEILVAAGADRSVLINKDRTGYIIVFLVTLLVSTIVGSIVLYLTRRWYKARLEEGKLNHNGQSYIVAIKKFIKFSANQAKYEEIYFNVEHDHITKILGICVGDGNIKLVTKWREDGALCYYLQKKRKDLKPVNLLTYCYQISQAMKYLGTKNITHCDLSTRNVLVKNEMHVEITDFGLARSIDKEDPLQDANATLSLRWAAIELLDPASKVPKFTVETDVWAFGVTCWEIFTFASEPYAELKLSDLSQEQRRPALYKHLKNNNFLVPPEICNFQLKAIMSTCLTREPRDRPSFSDLTRNFNKLLANPDRYLKMDNNLLKKLPFVNKNNDTNNWHVTAQPLNPKEDAELDLKKEEQNNLVQTRKAVITRTTSENSVLTNVQVPMKDVRFVLNGKAVVIDRTAVIDQAALDRIRIALDRARVANNVQITFDNYQIALDSIQAALDHAQVSNNIQLSPEIYQASPETYQFSSDSGQSSLNINQLSPDIYQIAPESYQLSSDSGQSSLNNAKVSPESYQVSPDSLKVSPNGAQLSSDSGQDPTINNLNV